MLWRFATTEASDVGVAVLLADKEPISSTPAPPMRILVVDDQPRNVEAIRIALSDYEEQVVPAHSGAEALRLLLHEDFALILLDVQLPDLDGFQVARLVRERERSKDTPIIFATAFSQTDTDILKGYALGAVDFLFKPIVVEVLRAKVGVLLALQERTAQIRLQAAQLRTHERRAHERALEAERTRWQEEALRSQVEAERQRAQDLARTVSKLKRAEDELSRSNKALEEVDQRKNEFLAYLAHELRNPLAPIAAGLELVRDAIPEGAEEAKVAQEAMERQLSHLTRLVDDLLDVARINSGRIQLDRQSLQVDEIISHALPVCQPIIERREHELAIMQPSEPIFVHGDLVRLTQALANLLNNAASYTPPRGKISVRVTHDNENVYVAVQDNGRGMSQELLSSAFEMFFREGDGSRGLGVGLALAQRMIDLHGGKITAQSSGADQGSIFQFSLPRHTPTQDPGEPAPTLEIDMHGIRVVVVEDNDDIRELMCIALQRRGLNVLTASDGKSGLELILRTRPDVAVVDFGLPGMDGCQVAEAVRAELNAEQIQLIAVTGYGQKSDRDRTKLAGFDLHLVKPVRPRRLVESIAELLSGKKTST